MKIKERKDPDKCSTQVLLAGLALKKVEAVQKDYLDKTGLKMSMERAILKFIIGE